MATGVDSDQLGCCDPLHNLLVKHPYILVATEYAEYQNVASAGYWDRLRTHRQL